MDEQTIWPAETYLPIELWKDPKAGFHPSPWSKRFLSSGTSAGENLRSSSYFSREGLRLYRQSALWSWEDFLSLFPSRPKKFFSLIPPKDQWPDSSLAQMIHWFTEGVDSWEYGAAWSDLPAHEPCLVFGTSGHWMELWKQKFRCLLPEGSAVVETGGTKYQEEYVPRKIFLDRIKVMTGVTRVFSEYGMSELACQAYGTFSLGWKFPPWVQLRVLTDQAGLQPKGLGALTVYDPLRVDYPWPLRTQDLVQLEAHGKFFLLGRMPQSSPKSCSLNVQKKEKLSTIKTMVSWKACSHKKSFVSSEKRWNIWQEFWSHLLKDEKFLQSWQKDLGPWQGRWALEDLTQSQPSTWEACSQALEISGVLSCLRWLFILPRNHPMVLYYPLALGYIAGVDLWVRDPGNWLSTRYFLNKFQKLPFQRMIWVRPGEGHHLQASHSYPPRTGVLAYGNDENFKFLRKIFPPWVFLAWLGSSEGAAVVHGIPGDMDMEGLWRDVASLGQRGCMSAQCVFAVGLSIEEAEILREKLILVAQNFDKPSFFQTMAWEGARSRYEKGPFLMPRNNASPLFPIIRRDAFLKDPVAGVLPILLSSQEPLGGPFLSLSSDRPSGNLRPLGKLQAPPWDGLHQEKPLFRADLFAKTFTHSC